MWNNVMANLRSGQQPDARQLSENVLFVPPLNPAKAPARTCHKRGSGIVGMNSNNEHPLYGFLTMLEKLKTQWQKTNGIEKKSHPI